MITPSSAAPESQRPRHAALAGGAARAVWRGRGFLAFVLAALAAVSCGLVTMALWNTSATAAGPIVTTGHLEIELGGLLWEETTIDSADGSNASGFDAAGLKALRLTPGDSLFIDQVVTIDGLGGNLQFMFSARLADGADPASLAPLVATYKLMDENGQSLTGADQPLNVGDELEVGPFPEGEHEFYVIIWIEYPRSYTPLYAAALDAPAATVAVPSLELSAQQVRGTA
ncbi:MAG: hypothetical protein LBD97_05030 [Bifidobacteriaceae bacterium]|jgi:alternate signal-mediated exported protein|nr:hypothetical protein [Bifidobacteriaceae bacterium]